MYKLIIVDDEPTVRYGLRHYLDWSEFGIAVAGEADDGDTGLEEVRRIRPDIVLTDVRMLNMDGITMASEIRASFPQTKIVFVSGHDDAEYLKSALQVDAVDYIFKPVNMQELRAVIERVVGTLQEEERQRALVSDMQVKLTQSMPLLREKFLMSVIRDGIAQPERVQERLQFLGLELPPEAAYWVIVVRIDDSADIVETRSERDRQLLSYAVLNVCQELIDRHMSGYAFEHQNGEYVGILRKDDALEHPEDMLFVLAEDIRGNLQKWLKLSVTIGIGEQAPRLSALPASYGQAKEAADHKWYLGKNRIITMDSLKQDEEHPNRFDQAASDRLLSALKAADPGLLSEQLGELFVQLAKNRRDGFRYARNAGLQIILLSNRLLLELNVRCPSIEDGENELLDRVFRLETIDDLHRLLESHLVQVCGQIREKRSGKSRNVIERIRAVMDTRYAENITVADIAESVYLSPTYVSLLFKQETGETVYEYLTKVRIEKAKELLRDPSRKFYEVSEAVGYSDPSHFSKIFKKHTGFTPSTYRDQVI
ncbi:response regulator [Paenibacillus hamazuiensis]|uniref:response regulator n=1 Tax=Paenibacillus hamazuiensis TaxID=2936508 RepID=UPI00201065B6|nr:response regulator [Paenibacillus hamazuiensis]